MRGWANIRKDEGILTWHTAKQMENIGNQKCPGSIKLEYEKIEIFNSLHEFFDAQFNYIKNVK